MNRIIKSLLAAAALAGAALATTSAPATAQYDVSVNVSAQPVHNGRGGTGAYLWAPHGVFSQAAYVTAVRPSFAGYLLCNAEDVGDTVTLTGAAEVRGLYVNIGSIDRDKAGARIVYVFVEFRDDDAHPNGDCGYALRKVSR